MPTSNKPNKSKKTKKSILEQLTDEEKDEIRKGYQRYLEIEEERSPELFEKSNLRDSVPFIDRPAKEQRSIKARYELWNWDNETLEHMCVYEPAFSDQSFKGVFVDEEHPITSRNIKACYERLADKFMEEAKNHSSYCLDFLEYTGNVNSLTGRGRKGIAGWLWGIAVLSESQLAKQVKHELRVQSEETQFAVQISSRLHDLSMDIKKLVEEMFLLDGVYDAILEGRRRMDIEYLDNEGNFIHWNFFRDKTDTEENRQFMKEIEEERARILESKKAPD